MRPWRQSGTDSSQAESPEVLTFTRASFNEKSDFPGCISFTASTNGKMGFDFSISKDLGVILGCNLIWGEGQGLALTAGFRFWGQFGCELSPLKKSG